MASRTVQPVTPGKHDVVDENGDITIPVPPTDIYTPEYGVIVMLDGEQEQRAAFEHLKDLGYKCRVATV